MDQWVLSIQQSCVVNKTKITLAKQTTLKEFDQLEWYVRYVRYRRYNYVWCCYNWHGYCLLSEMLKNIYIKDDPTIALLTLLDEEKKE